CEASGRNAGNFELLPENSVGTYGGFARERLRFLRRCYPEIPLEVLRVEAERQASLVLSFAIRNRERLKQIISQENLACDFSPKGWLYLAHTEAEEQAICDEVAMANRQDQQIEIWSRMKIRQEFGFESGFIGRFVPGDGTYHPAKFVYGVLQVAVAAGVELYTDVSVQQVHAGDGGVQVIQTNHGPVAARAVIVATNAFTRELFPELAAITPAQSQIAVTEGASDRCRGRVVTSEDGPVYFNQPRDGAADGIAPLLLGGGKDRPMRNASSRRRVPAIHAKLLKLRARFFPELKSRPFSSEWVGPIALTPDQIPAIGFLRPGIVIAAGFNGYGGSYCVAAGEAAAEMAITAAVPEWLPEDVFSPQRLLHGKPLFFGEVGSLWCYAASLSVQLRAINRQLHESFPPAAHKKQPAATRSQAAKSSALVSPWADVTACFAEEDLRSVKLFRNFSLDECGEILRVAKLRRISQGEPLHSGDAASCFVVLQGTAALAAGRRVNSSAAAAGPGDVIGHLSLLDGSPDWDTYVAQQDSAVLELTHADCHRLLACRSPLSQKLLEAFAEAIIAALKKSERQLKARNRQRHPRLPLVRVAGAN
ncbi:MAG TPA: FAD-dependent oxidoreductase, partial [Terriglobales bacterium]|nr:FAD-dependent oxidoreductase [Terriglobales bacterium]